MMEKITVPAQQGLDPVYAYFDNIGEGSGRVVLICWDMAYTAYWGAIGNKTVQQFFAGCGVDYIAARMHGRHYKRGATDIKYLEKIVRAVHDHMNLVEEKAA